MATTQRPLSPHLQVYKPQLTSVLSIVHRMTGVFLTIGAVFLVAWLWSLQQGPATFAAFQNFAGSGVGRLLLLAWSYAFFYHLCNGIRHLVWDIGIGFEMDQVYRSGWIVLVASLLLTVGVWLGAYAARGGT